MTLADIVGILDRKYADEPVECPNETKMVKMNCGYQSERHGNLVVHGSGSFLVCGRCGYNTPVARP